MYMMRKEIMILSIVSSILGLLILLSQITEAQPSEPTLYNPGDLDGDGNYIVEWSDVSLPPTVETLDLELPTPKAGASAVWDGQYTYIFGGYWGGDYLDDITRFDPATNNVTTLPAKLPTGRYGTSAIWDGQYVYIFGGKSSNPRYLDEIVRFDPATNNITTLSAILPYGGIAYTSAVWDGKHAYIFGGNYGLNGNTSSVICYMIKILRFDPDTQEVTILNVLLPKHTTRSTAVWTGKYAYIFGGYHGDDPNYCLDDIVRFDPGSNTVKTLSVKLPTGRDRTSSVWDGEYAYIFGGYEEYNWLDEIVCFNPTSNSVSTLTATLPSKRDFTSAIWSGQYTYIFGGSKAGHDIVRFKPGTGTVYYSLEEDNNPDFSSPIQIYSGTELSYAIKNRPDGTYYYRVNSSNVYGSSDWGNVVNITVDLDFDDDGALNWEDVFPYDPTQWDDKDNDGYGDNPSGNNPDKFPTDSTQWDDTDGDGYGDNQTGNYPDRMPAIWGNSTMDYFGCPDKDGDGWSNLTDKIPNDPAAKLDFDGDGYPDEWNHGKSEADSTTGLTLDAFPTDSTQWDDTDGDYFGDNPDGNNPDAFPDDPAASLDTDGDRYPDRWNEGKGSEDSTTGLILDAFPRNAKEWVDTDGDGIGDNSDLIPIHNTIFLLLMVSVILVSVYIKGIFKTFKKLSESREPEDFSIEHK